MAWSIEQANNSLKEFRLKRHTGQIVKVKVPERHVQDIAAKAYVQAVQDGHDAVLSTPIRGRVILCLSLMAGSLGALIEHKIIIVLAPILILVEARALYRLIKSR